VPALKSDRVDSRHDSQKKEERKRKKKQGSRARHFFMSSFGGPNFYCATFQPTMRAGEASVTRTRAGLVTLVF
jgi:hypothetical protein